MTEQMAEIRKLIGAYLDQVWELAYYRLMNRTETDGKAEELMDEIRKILSNP